MTDIIRANRSIIPACDFNSVDDLRTLLLATKDISEVSAYKVGFELGLSYSLSSIVDVVKRHTNKLVIYDHQKAGTDVHEYIPDKFMDVMRNADVDAVILFPQAGPITQYEWINAAKDRNLDVILGGEMTHPRYLEGDFNDGITKNYDNIFYDLGIERKLTGYIRRHAPEDIYELAAKMDVTNFVIPGNKPAQIKHYTKFIQNHVKDASFYSPALISQDGKLNKALSSSIERWHAIIGRNLYETKNIKDSIYAYISELCN